MGLTRADLASRVERLAGTLRRAGIEDPSWSAWLHAFRATPSGDLTSAAERLAQFAERLGGAMGGRIQVAGVNVGAGLVRDVPPEVMAVENALGSVIDAIAPVLPYGNVIKGAHDLRRGIMYGPPESAKAPGQGAAPARQAPLTAKVASAQATTRAVRRGDVAAKGRVTALRSRAAAGDSEARKDYAIHAAARRDDSKRIDTVYRSRGGR